MRLGSVVAFAVATMAVAGCGSSEGDAAEDDSVAGVPLHQTVEISGFRYQPRHARVLIGGTVTWVNKDPEQDHTAETLSSRYRHMSNGERADFDTHALTWNEPYTVTFHKPGTFEYFCSFHSEMKGEVEVVVRTAPR